VRRTLVTGALLLFCLTGAADGGTTSDQALAVSVDGPGAVAAAGIACRDEGGDCVELYGDGATVTLTASPDPGMTFAGWGGDCSAGTAAACTLTMSSAKAVTATFSPGGGSDKAPLLTVSVSGTGKVTGRGIDCGNGATDCSESYPPATAVTLTESPGTGVTFSGWGGACSGSGRTCTVTANGSQSASATFSDAAPRPDAPPAEQPASAPPEAASGTFTRATPRPTATFAARSLGRPLVARTSSGWAVTLRFFTSRAGTGLVRLSLKGRLVGAFTFSPPRGGVRVGPFRISRPGAYRFQLTLGDRRGATARLSWNLVL
jgi:Divergent InlB B-repeat domain